MSKPSCVGAVILAAGASVRLGQPKQLLFFEGETLLSRAANVACRAGCTPVVVVLGANAKLMRQELENCSVTMVENANWVEGMGGSIRAGVNALLTQCSSLNALLLMTCDQPLISSEKIGELLERYRTARVRMVAAAYEQTLGVPALFDRDCFSELLNLDAAQGAKHLLLRDPQNVASVVMPEAAVDIDTMEDYRAFTNGREPSPNPHQQKVARVTAISDERGEA